MSARRRVRGVLDGVLRDGAVIARSDGARHDVFPVAVPPEEGEALGGWVRRERARRTIEVGLGYGIATLVICEGLLANGHVAARHVAIDPNQATRFASVGLQLIEEAGLGWLVEVLPEESQTALPRLMSEGSTFDLAFVDGNHRFDGVFLDLVHLGRVLRPGGVVFLDDYQLPAVAKAVSFCVTNLGWALEEVSARDPHHTWAVLRTSRVPDTRPFDHFVHF